MIFQYNSKNYAIIKRHQIITSSRTNVEKYGKEKALKEDLKSRCLMKQKFGNILKIIRDIKQYEI